MTTELFIKNQIDALVNRFKKISCQYEYNNLTQTHFLEILPKMYFSNHSLLNECMMDLLDEFYDKFPNYNLSFFTAGSGLKIKKPLYVRIGYEYTWLNIGSQVLKLNIKPIENHTDIVEEYNSGQPYLAA